MVTIVWDCICVFALLHIETKDQRKLKKFCNVIFYRWFIFFFFLYSSFLSPSVSFFLHIVGSMEHLTKAAVVLRLFVIWFVIAAVVVFIGVVREWRYCFVFFIFIFYYSAFVSLAYRILDRYKTVEFIYFCELAISYVNLPIFLNLYQRLYSYSIVVWKTNNFYLFKGIPILRFKENIAVVHHKNCIQY